MATVPGCKNVLVVGNCTHMLCKMFWTETLLDAIIAGEATAANRTTSSYNNDK